MTSRRSWGDGTIRQRPDGMWEIRVSLGRKADGRPDRRSAYGHTREEAARKARNLRSAYEEGTLTEPGRESVVAYLEAWLRDTHQHDVGAAWFKDSENLVRRHIVPALGKTKLRALRPADVRKLLNDKRAAGLSPSTVHHIYVVLRKALEQARQDRILPQNVATLVTPPSVPRSAIEPLTAEETRVFLSHVRGTRDHALYLAAFMLGARQGELLALRWEDVDLEAASVTIRRSLRRIDGEWLFKGPKSEAGNRVVSMPAVLVTALREHRTAQLEERLQAPPSLLRAVEAVKRERSSNELAGSGLSPRPPRNRTSNLSLTSDVTSSWEQYGLVFCRENGEPEHHRSVLARFQRALAEAGLPKRRFHDIRHTAVTLGLEAGIALTTISERVGHSDYRTTKNVYGHITEALDRDAAAKMQAVMGGGA